MCIAYRDLRLPAGFVAVFCRGDEREKRREDKREREGPTNVGPTRTETYACGLNKVAKPRKLPSFKCT